MKKLFIVFIIIVAAMCFLYADSISDAYYQGYKDALQGLPNRYEISSIASPSFENRYKVKHYVDTLGEPTGIPDLSIKYSEHIVKKGESLSSIATQYGLNVQTLISVNKIKNIAGVTEGVVLNIPDCDGHLYRVQSGDLLSTIARKFDLDIGWKQLQELNGLKSENLYVGQELFIPGNNQIGSGGITTSTVIFKKPVYGSITTSFGQMVEGVPLQGVYISCSAGSVVRASCKGTAIDTGSSPSLGRFLVLQHDNGYKTTYAFLERIEKKIGMDVEEGDVIGSIGLSSGKTNEPVLFFGLEKNGVALDPEVMWN